MTFTISGEPFLFTLVVDDGVLTSFTATDNGTTFDCFIQLEAQGLVEGMFCCTPTGCTSGGCSSAQL